jgi:hypothetical protein
MFGRLAEEPKKKGKLISQENEKEKEKEEEEEEKGCQGLKMRPAA